MQALQRGLPRPVSLALLPAPKPLSELSQMSLRERAEDAVIEEMQKRLNYDTRKYPLPPETLGKELSSKEAKKVRACVYHVCTTHSSCVALFATDLLTYFHEGVASGTRKSARSSVSGMD